MKHGEFDPCWCDACARKLIAAYEAYFQAWLRRALEEGKK